jgi:pentatricopeptide repeat protein
MRHAASDHPPLQANRSSLRLHKRPTPFLDDKRLAIARTHVSPEPALPPPRPSSRIELSCDDCGQVALAPSDAGLRKDAEYNYDAFPALSPALYAEPRAVRSLETGELLGGKQTLTRSSSKLFGSFSRFSSPAGSRPASTAKMGETLMRRGVYNAWSLPPAQPLIATTQDSRHPRDALSIQLVCNAAAPRSVLKKVGSNRFLLHVVAVGEGSAGLGAAGLEEGLLVLERMKQERLVPDEVASRSSTLRAGLVAASYQSAACVTGAAAAKCSRRFVAVRAYSVAVRAARLKGPVQVSYGALIEASGRAGCADKGMQLFEEMQSLGMKPDANVYGSLIKAVASSQVSPLPRSTDLPQTRD